MSERAALPLSLLAALASLDASHLFGRDSRLRIRERPDQAVQEVGDRRAQRRLTDALEVAAQNVLRRPTHQLAHTHRLQRHAPRQSFDPLLHLLLFDTLK